MTSNLLQGIANPTIANPGQSFLAGQQRGEARLTRDLSAKILSNTLPGRFGALANVNPSQALELAKLTGIPVGDVEQRNKFLGDTQFGATIIESEGPQAGAQFFREQSILFPEGSPLTQKYLEMADKLSSQDLEVQKQAASDLIISRDAFIKQGLIKAPPAAKTDQKQVNQLRKNVSDVTKDLKKVDAAFRKIQKAGSKGTAAGDMSLIFSFMKILDPGSTVREGEFATAQQTTGIPGQIVNAYNRALEGTRLNTAQRADFIDQSGSLFEAQRESADVSIGNILQQADEDQISRVKVLGKKRLGEFETRRTAQPQAISKPVTELTDEELEAEIRAAGG